MNDSSLSAQLRTVARDLAVQPLPPTLERDIERALRPQMRNPWRPLGLLSAAAAGLAGVMAALVVVFTPAEEPIASTPQLAGFVGLVASERWKEAAQRGSAWLVPTELPQSRLAALGLPYDPARAGDTVRAQLLVHSSGDVLAVRVIP